MLTSRTCPQSHLSAARKVCCGTLTRNAHGMLSWMTVACNIGNSAFAHPFVSRALPGFTWVTIRAGTARLPVHGLLPSLPPVMRSAGVLQHARRLPPHAGEEAQIIMEEVANLLRNSASSAGGLGAEQMRRLDSARSSLMSDLEAAQSLGSERAGSAEGLDPAFLARLGQPPSAPMPLKGGESSRPRAGLTLPESVSGHSRACPVPGQSPGRLSGDV